MNGDLQRKKKVNTFVNQTVHTIINDLTYWNRLPFVFRHILH